MNCPFLYNNFIYLVTLASPTPAVINLQSSKSDKVQHGTKSLPADTSSLIFRLANPDPAIGLNNTNRIGNEVAFTELARHALENSKYSRTVPEIYTWASMSSGQGFSVQKYMPGTVVDRVFNDLTLQDRAVVLGQMADILALLQNFRIPETVERLGGLKFDGDGKFISAQMTQFVGEPYMSYRDLICTIFKSSFRKLMKTL